MTNKRFRSQWYSQIVPGLLAGAIFLLACNKSASPPPSHLFTLLPADSTGITFSNQLTEGLNTNVLLYEYFYNGGGVAAGDVNGDGKIDLYFSANMTDNKLYLNKGAWHFEDITVTAGVAGRPGPWKTGITMADVNGDGRLDIYLCYSGKLRGEKRINQLFINNGNDAQGKPIFNEQAAAYGLADTAYSTQAYFFDYDRDGDLDALLVNHNPNALAVLDEVATAAQLKIEDPVIGPRLMENTNNHFTDVTRKSGIISSSLSYGLAAGIADINGDGWQDIYISNDYAVPDYLYINNGNGTFADQLRTSVGHNSQFSMGNDIADINNDGLPDLFTLDMLPADNRRQKLLTAPDNYEKFELNIRSGFHYQYMRNMLQLNNGNYFSEIGQLAGVSNTDWSWAPLLADYDSDGFKDLLVTNGYLRDFTNLDFVKYMNDYVQSKGRLKREDVLELVHKIPASNVVNYLFKNNGNTSFNDVSRAWGFEAPSSSNGAAYADLDNDGDLDLVINNINAPAFVYRNESDSINYLQVQLNGLSGNTQGIGAKLIVYTGNTQQYLEQMPARGYLSCVSPVLQVGLGNTALIDSLRVVWLSGRQQLVNNVRSNQVLQLNEKEATGNYRSLVHSPAFFTNLPSPVNYTAPTNIVNDFKRQPLLVNPLSFSGPCLAKGDVNGDGKEDLYAGGGNLFLQQANGNFIKSPQPAFEADKQSEDADAVFFDANGDGFIDLYVASGGYHNYLPDDALLQDRLYLNDGKGHFATGKLPEMRVSKSCVRVNDVNNDGHPDLFVGGRVIPGRYPETPESFLLINDGKGNFTNQVTTLAPALQRAGMITDAAWVDMNKDGKKDLVVVGEWMPITIYKQTANSFIKTTLPYTGWWNKLQVADLNKDGLPDLVVGNTGLNTQCRVSDKEPAELYYKDFDDNGAIDPIFCFYIQGKSYPYLTRDELLDQVSMMRTRFIDYKSYADATVEEIFGKEALASAGHLQANCLETVLLINDGKGGFTKQPLPLQAQYAPVYTITTLDYNKDGNEDLLLCGNTNHARLRFGKSDANFGTLFQGNGKGGFTYIDQQRSGFHIWGDVRTVLSINDLWLFGVNGAPLTAYKLKMKNEK